MPQQKAENDPAQWCERRWSLEIGEAVSAPSCSWRFSRLHQYIAVTGNSLIQVNGCRHGDHGTQCPITGLSRPDGIATSRHLAARVEDCGVPEVIIFIEALPRGLTGKLDRLALREQLSFPKAAP